MQAGGFVQVQDRFRNAYQEVKTTMAQLYSFFQTDSEEVQREWLKFTHKVHHSVTLQHTHTHTHTHIFLCLMHSNL